MEAKIQEQSAQVIVISYKKNTPRAARQALDLMSQMGVSHQRKKTGSDSYDTEDECNFCMNHCPLSECSNCLDYLVVKRGESKVSQEDVA